MDANSPDNSYRGFAPGKLLLFGEHAVVYGAQALGFPVSRGITATLKPGLGSLRITLADGLETPETDHAVAPAELVRQALGDQASNVDVHLHLAVPPMCGFGTSAALAVALLRAQEHWHLSVRQQPPTPRSPKELWKAALLVEHTAHATPSGVDPAVVVWNQPIIFQRNTDGTTTIEPISVTQPLYVLVGWCGHHYGARVSVTGLSVLRETHPLLIESAMMTLNKAAYTGAHALRTGDLPSVGLAANLAHGVLSGLGLVSTAVESAVRTARSLGALGAKMSGAGGAGGAWLAIFRSAEEATAAAEHMRHQYPNSLWIETLYTPK
ncbi:MAG: hypothetical protein KTR25_08725 [Myxococcales bacterium]|nr:hypothetical protein [Myxococcales bacterium]